MKIEKLLNDALNPSKPIQLAKLRRKAAKLGLTIDIERYGREVCYWIEGGDDSIWEGDRFCSSKEEIGYKLAAFD